jgi:hypothetical protein
MLFSRSTHVARCQSTDAQVLDVRQSPARSAGMATVVQRSPGWPHEDQHGSRVPGQGHRPAALQDTDPHHRHGRLAGIFFFRPEITLPIELKRELYDMLSSDVARQLKRRKVSEDHVLEDFEASRKKRRATRRRR